MNPHDPAHAASSSRPDTEDVRVDQHLELHRALVADLAGFLDLDAGLDDIVLDAHHADLVHHAATVLDLPAGLADIIATDPAAMPPIASQADEAAGPSSIPSTKVAKSSTSATSSSASATAEMPNQVDAIAPDTRDEGGTLVRVRSRRDLDRRLDPGDWSERPVPRRPVAPHLAILRHRTELELGTIVLALAGAIWFASDSWPRLVVVVLVLSSLFMVGVREMVLGQFRRIVLQRRLQHAFGELGICSRRRRLTPSVLGSAALPGATAVRVWLPVGLTIDDLAARRHDLAEVCFVDTVVFERRPGRLGTVEMVMVHRILRTPT